MTERGRGAIPDLFAFFRDAYATLGNIYEPAKANNSYILNNSPAGSR